MKNRYLLVIEDDNGNLSPKTISASEKASFERSKFGRALLDSEQAYIKKI